MINKKPVFFDATGKRAARLATLGWTAALFLMVVAIGFVASLMMANPVANVDLPGRAYATNPPELVKKAVAVSRKAVRKTVKKAAPKKKAPKKSARPAKKSSSRSRKK